MKIKSFGTLCLTIELITNEGDGSPAVIVYDVDEDEDSFNEHDLYDLMCSWHRRWCEWTADQREREMGRRRNDD